MSLQRKLCTADNLHFDLDLTAALFMLLCCYDLHAVACISRENPGCVVVQNLRNVELVVARDPI